MRSFIVSIIATLAFALFAYAAPMPAMAAPVNAIAARQADNDHPTFEKTFTKCIDGVKPHTDELAALKADVKVEVILKIIAEIKLVLKVAIEEVKVMVKLELDDILCGSDGAKIGVTVIAGLCVQLMLLIFKACISVLAVVSVDIKVQVCAILADLCCLLGDLICAILEILVVLRVEIIACILPQIAACIELIVFLKLDIFIKLFGIPGY